MIDFESYYWRLKHLYPGDPEFSFNNFHALPWAYVLRAVAKGVDNYHDDLHNRERPSALLASLFVNSKRDTKKNKSVGWGDFCFYKPRNDGNSASVENGTAMILLAKKGLLPSWCLFCFKEVTTHNDPTYTPETLALIAEDATLIHPVKEAGGYKGLLIAMESASGQRRVFKSENGETITLTVPSIHTKVVAEEGVTLFS